MKKVQHYLHCLGAIFRIQLAESLQYRAAALSGALTSLFWGAVLITCYRVFFLRGSQAAFDGSGMTLEMTVSYLWLSQAFFALMNVSPDVNILSRIGSGDIGVELLRPFSLYSFWFAKNLASTMGKQWLRAAVSIGVGLLLPYAYRLQLPASWGGFAMFLVSLVFSLLECSAFAMILAGLQMNIAIGSGPSAIVSTLAGLFAGAILPLRLWPQSLQKFLAFQPFAGLGDVPMQCYIGSLSPAEALPRLGLQLFWTVVFILLGSRLMKRRLRGIVIQGG